MCVFFLFQITELCLEYLCYDPNYNYGDDGNDEDDDPMNDNVGDDEVYVLLNFKVPLVPLEVLLEKFI